jgi:hypothetical protein
MIIFHAKTQRNINAKTPSKTLRAFASFAPLRGRKKMLKALSAQVSDTTMPPKEPKADNQKEKHP